MRILCFFTKQKTLQVDSRTGSIKSRNYRIHGREFQCAGMQKIGHLAGGFTGKEI